MTAHRKPLAKSKKAAAQKHDGCMGFCFESWKIITEHGYNTVIYPQILEAITHGKNTTKHYNERLIEKQGNPERIHHAPGLPCGKWITNIWQQSRGGKNYFTSDNQHYVKLSNRYTNILFTT